METDAPLLNLCTAEERATPSGLQTNGELRGLHSASAANPPYDVFLKSSPAYGFGGCAASASSLGSVPQPGRSGTIRCPASICGGCVTSSSSRRGDRCRSP